jgi:hypothetical protein
VVPLLSETAAVRQLLEDSLYAGALASVDSIAELMIERLGSVGCKTALRLAERVVTSTTTTTTTTSTSGDTAGAAATVRDLREVQLSALTEIFDDLAGDELSALETCTLR